MNLLYMLNLDNLIIEYRNKNTFIYFRILDEKITYNYFIYY
jgi:hypothetical protein